MAVAPFVDGVFDCSVELGFSSLSALSRSSVFFSEVGAADAVPKLKLAADLASGVEPSASFELDGVGSVKGSLFRGSEGLQKVKVEDAQQFPPLEREPIQRKADKRKQSPSAGRK